jgi:hypothetical protein
MNHLLDPFEVYICVDVETARPIPGPKDYSLLSIGACSRLEPLAKFYIELQPSRRIWTKYKSVNKE